MTTARLHGALAALLSAATAGACGREPPGGESTLSILLTDQPEVRLASAVVTLSRVTLRPRDADPVVLRDTPYTVDLVGLSNDADVLVDAAVVPEDEYVDLRFVLEGAAIGITDGSRTRIYATPGYRASADGTLRTPPRDPDGFAVRLGGPLELFGDGDARVLLVDFDLAESFGPDADGAWAMRPVLEGVDLDRTASVGVEVGRDARVTLPSDLRVRLLDAKGLFESEIALTNEDADPALEATFRFVDPREGPFTVVLVPPAGATLQVEPEVVAGVPARDGEISEVSFDPRIPGA